MSAMNGFLGRAEQNRRYEEVQAIQNGRVDRSGTRVDVYDGLRGKVKPMPEEDLVEENHERLAGTGLIADADINSQNLTELALWPDTGVVNQQEATNTVEEAVKEYGADSVIEKTVRDLLDEFTGRGIVYSDPADNIGFFYGEPKAFDVYDDSAFDIYDSRPEEMSEADFHCFECSTPVMYQKFAGDVARKSGLGQDEAAVKVADASRYFGSDLESIVEFGESFEYER